VVQGSKSRVIAAAKVDPARRGRVIPRSFLGFSLEYSVVPRYVGTPTTGPNRAFLGLLDNLVREGSGRPVIRVGGGSSDEAWWNPQRRPRPRGFTYDITQRWVDGLRNFRSVTRSPLILGLNLAANDPRIAAEWARVAVGSFGRNTVFELGNEPDLFGTRPFGRDPNGRTLTARPRSYRLRNYFGDFRRFSRVLRRLRPRPRIAGPVACCDPGWQRGLPAFLRRFRRQVSHVTYHAYPSHNCRRPKPLFPPTTRALLSEPVTSAFGAHYWRMAAQSRRYRRPLRVTETNSIACGGREGVSDTFAAALWGADWMFTLANFGASGADFHSTSQYYTPFSFYGPFGRIHSAVARPLYYGMLLFAHATRNRGRIIEAARSRRVFARSRANVKFWATHDRRRTVRLVVLNKDRRRSGLVRLRIRGARRAGTLIRLRAQRLSSKTEVEFAGQTVPVGTNDGRLVGQRVSARVRRRGRDTYVFRMPRASAALLTVRGVRRR
jgi:hypothetical protein